MFQSPVSMFVTAGAARIGRAGAAVALAVGFAVAPFLAAPALAAPVHTFYPVAGATDEPQDPVFLGSGMCHSIPSGVCTLRAAVMEANYEGVYIAIALTAGTYHLTIPPTGTTDASTGDLVITDPQTVAITGAGASQTIVDGTGMGDRIFQLQDHGVARMTGFTITHGDAAAAGTTDPGVGGGIDVSSESAALVLSRMRITANTAVDEAGGLFSIGSLSATDTTISGNTARLGGGYVAEAAARLVNVAITGNTAQDYGGGVVVYDGPLAIQGGSVSGNHVVFQDGGTGQGGGLFIQAATTLDGTTISNNTIAPESGATSGTAQGGGIYAGAGLNRADRLTVRGNTVSGFTPSSEGCSGDSGGGIYDYEGIALTNSVVSGNKALTGLAGGILNCGEIEQLTQVSVTGNTAATSGGGIYAESATDISRSTISGNVAGGNGGGIFSNDSQQIDQSLIANNRAVQGAGLWNQWRAQLTNDTLTGNVAAGPGNAGGAIYNNNVNGTSSVQLTNVTISGNRSDDGGGIAQFGISVSAHNTIIAGNRATSGTTDTNCDVTSVGAGPLTDVGSNIDSGHTCGLNGPGSRSNTNPRLGALASNGGPTRTQALLTGSPAINAGSQPAPTIDQRGVRRDSRPDIGAYEKR
jgi:predicted outer membrane repeat protein